MLSHMISANAKARRILKLARDTGIVSTRDVRSLGIHHEYLRRLYEKGLLDRIGRGLYILPDADLSIHHSLAQACKVVPKGTICLLSALRFHEIGTQLPPSVWIAIDRRAAKPLVKIPRMRFMRFSGKALTEGIETHTIEGVPVRVYNAAKTVADCFKYRNKIGLDVAIEALREALRNRKCTVDDLVCFAEICRVSAVMRPYMEAIV